MERAHLSQVGGKGFYWDVLRAIYESEGVELKTYSAPFFKDNLADIR